MKKIITGVYVNAESHTALPYSVKGELEEYYKLLGVSCIDIVSRKIGGKYYDIICDDEALLKENPICSMIDKSGNPMLFGNLFICSHNEEGEEISLDSGDISRILHQLKRVIAVTKDSMKIENFLEGSY